MVASITSMFSTTRGLHSRLPTDDDATSQNSIVEDDSGIEANNSRSSSNSNGNSSGIPDIVVETVQSDDETEELNSSNSNTDVDVETGNADADDDAMETAAARLTATLPLARAANTVTLSELEEERELARRRTSGCVLLAVFVLFRLWIEALRNGDVFIMMLCLFGTSWTARLIRHNREHEEALDERIRVYLENADPNTTEIDRNDLRFLSFQAQLALAMMESQRQIQQGGYGNPDGHNGNAGVSEDAKSKWEHFAWKEGMEDGSSKSNSGGGLSPTTATTTKGDYGSVAQNEQQPLPSSSKEGLLEEDGPHCSICLGEYEDGEKLVKLPCNHIYHEDCVGSWTTNHTRCPLCNLDLESVTSSSSCSTSTTTAATAADATRSSPPVESIV